MSALSERISAEINERGLISFERFMELALYCPVYGYYEKEADTIGTRGDYLTSVSIGDLFGQLLAFQFAEWLGGTTDHGSRAVDHGLEDGSAVLVEAGAHRGDLARDILSWLRSNRSDLFEKLTYWIVEPSLKRQEWQRNTLNEFSPTVRWATALNRLPAIRGMIFCNELLDAMPVRRFGWDAANNQWFEWGVGFGNGRFVWERLPDKAAPGLGNFGLGLPDGFVIERCATAEQWWSEAARILSEGKLMAIDYGFRGDEFLSPSRVGGTLRTYSGHHIGGNVLSNPGCQDITAHVNFSQIEQAGTAAGLKTDLLASQEHFLTAITARLCESCRFEAFEAKKARQFRLLTHPDHLGACFQVLVQSRKKYRFDKIG